MQPEHNTAQYNTKAAAIAGMSPTYFTGRPCKHEHIAPRYTSNGMCVECLKMHRVTSGSLAKRARIQANQLSAADMVEAKVWVPRKHSTILHTITRLLNAPDAAATITWLEMLDRASLDIAILAPLFDWRDNKVNIDPATFPMRNADDGRLLVQLRNAWYVGDEIMEVLRGQRATVERVWE